MKKHQSIILISLVIFAIALWWLWPAKETNAPKATTVPTAYSNAQQASNLAVANNAAGTPVTPQQTINPQTQTQALNPSPALTRVEQAQVWVNSKNGDISFYGMVVDQNSNPVPDVKIEAQARQWYMATPDAANVAGKMIPVTEETGADGRFEIQGIKGDALDFKNVQKAGYELSSKVSRSYGISSGSLDNPVVFKMWKKDAAAQLISQDKDTRIPYDGTPVVFDLLTGQKNGGNSVTGDLRVTLTRIPLNIPLGYKTNFEWHATIEAIDGGLIQSDDEFMYAAPEEGYQPEIKIDMLADSTNWKPVYDISFFAKTRGGNVYSRVKFEFRADSSKPQTGFTIVSSANSTGSRNLEP